MPKQYESYNHIPQVLLAVDKVLRQESEEVQKQVRARARTKPPSPLNPGPYATGATMAGLYIVTAKGSDYGPRWRDAKRLGRKDLESHKQDELKLPEALPHVYHSATVGMFDYNYRVHEGWAHIKKYVPAQPFLREATREERSAHSARIMDRLRKIKGFR